MQILIQNTPIIDALKLALRPNIVKYINKGTIFDDVLQIFKMGPLTIPVVVSSTHFDEIMNNGVMENMTRLPQQVEIFEAFILGLMPKHLHEKLKQTSGLQSTYADSPHRPAMHKNAANALGKFFESKELVQRLQYKIAEKTNINSAELAEQLTYIMVSEMLGMFTVGELDGYRQLFQEMREMFIMKFSPAAIFTAYSKEADLKDRAKIMLNLLINKLEGTDTYHNNETFIWLNGQVAALGIEFGTTDFYFAMALKVITLLQALLDTTPTLISSLLIALGNNKVYQVVMDNPLERSVGAIYLALHMASPLIVDPRVAIYDFVLAKDENGNNLMVKKGGLIYFNLLNVGRHRLALSDDFKKFIMQFFAEHKTRQQRLRACHFASVFMGVDQFSCEGSGRAVAFADLIARLIMENPKRPQVVDSSVHDVDLQGVMIQDAQILFK